MTQLVLYLTRCVPTNIAGCMTTMAERVKINVEDAELSSLLAQGYSLMDAQVVSYTTPATAGFTYW